jgi:predicted DNA-binding antitoxin AbrB/MazE fold protein
MTMIIQAVYEGGVLRPTRPLALPEGQTVDVTISPSASCAASASTPEDEMVRRIQACRSYQEWLEVTKSLPADDADFDIIRALDENRRWSGERPLLPNGGGQP